MISNFFKKYTEKHKKVILVKTIIENLNINEKQKNLYLETLDYLDEAGLDKLYSSLERFISEIESRELEDIKENNFSSIAGMRKKEALEKQKELNSFGFLLNNL